MRVKLPTKTQVAEVAQNLGMTLSNAEVDTYRELMESYVQRYNVVDLMPDELPVVSYPRTTGYRPEGEDNKLNAWAVKSEISGAAEGPLAGKTVAIKDNVMVAGMGMNFQPHLREPQNCFCKTIDEEEMFICSQTTTSMLGNRSPKALTHPVE